MEPLDYDDNQNTQKILEICHLGKFLYLLDEDIKIKTIAEKPDFILENDNLSIGLEHRIIVDNKSKKREVFFQDIFRKVELELKKDINLPNFLANCYIYENINFKIKEKSQLKKTIIKVIKTYIMTGVLLENPVII